jgi:phosphatidylglycerophosphate synthase
MNESWRRTIPWSMVVFRAALAPLLLVIALKTAHSEIWLGAIIAAAFLSDVFDGILARHWKTETSKLRVGDSSADLFFYLCVLGACIVRHGPAIRERLGWVIALTAFEALRIGFDFIKFRRMASYHSYASKFWGILLALTTVALLAFDRAFWLITFTLAWGILCNLEGLTMSAMLPKWTHDVKTLRQALALRRQMLARARLEPAAR